MVHAANWADVTNASHPVKTPFRQVRLSLLWGTVGVVLCVTAGAMWLFLASRTDAAQESVLDSVKKQLWETTRRRFHAYAETHAVSGPLQKEYFADSEQREDHFRFVAYLDKGLLPVIQNAMRLGTDRQRKVWIEQHRQWIENYRKNLSDAERERLQKAMRSPEGQRLIDDAGAYMLSRLSAGEKVELQPLIQEIITTLEENQVRQ